MHPTLPPVVRAPLERWRVVLPLLAMLGCFVQPTLARAETSPDSGTPSTPPPHRPKIGLVLSGGGALGMTHIGVLRRLEELHIPIDYITGTSMGGLLGGLYASGVSVDELESFARDMDWKRLFNDNPDRFQMTLQRKNDDYRYVGALTVGFREGRLALPSGILQGQRQNILFKQMTLPVWQASSFDELPIPFHCMAVDLATGDAVTLKSGDLGTALRATMSIPGVFAPVELDGKRLVDGGVADNLPIHEVRKMGADIVIAANISSGSDPKQSADLLSITSSVIVAMIEKSSRLQINTLTPRDTLIEPQFPPGTSIDFEGSDKLIPLGYEAAKAREAQLAALAVSAEEYEAIRAARKRPTWEAPPIAFIHIENKTHLDDRVLRAQVQQKLGQPLDIELLERDIEYLYGLGVIEWISYRLVEENGKIGLALEVREKSWGPGFVSAGLELQDNMLGNNSYLLRASYRRLQLNRRGGELHNEVTLGARLGYDGEWYQPLTYRMSWFGAAGLGVTFQSLPIDQIPEENVTSARNLAFSGHVAFGRNLGRLGEIRAGLSSDKLFTYVTTDAGSKVEQSLLTVGFATLHIDTLDNAYFPDYGIYAGLTGELGLPIFTETFGYRRLEAELGGAWSVGRNTFSAYARAGSQDRDPALLGPFSFTLGGLFNLSGYNPDALRDDAVAFGRLTYRRKAFGSHNSLVPFPLFLGFSLEAGNVYHNIHDFAVTQLIPAASVSVGVNSAVGPVYLAFGRAGNGTQSLNLFLGRLF